MGTHPMVVPFHSHYMRNGYMVPLGIPVLLNINMSSWIKKTYPLDYDFHGIIGYNKYHLKQ